MLFDQMAMNLLLKRVMEAWCEYIHCESGTKIMARSIGKRARLESDEYVLLTAVGCACNEMPTSAVAMAAAVFLW